ncbi:MAG: fold metallo-hydrolase [Subtercola sp.]|nr:fold metallo-hydrolase [Subtercola sp.]
MTVVSEKQENGAPAFEEIAPGLWLLPLPLPAGHMPFVLCYLIEDSAGGVHVVDPGWDSDSYWSAFERALRRIGKTVSDVASVIVTHLHSDHLGMAERLVRASGASIVLHRAEQSAVDQLLLERAGDPERSRIREQLALWGVPSVRSDELVAATMLNYTVSAISADVLLDDGDILPIAGRSMSTIWAPGHTKGSICLVEPDERLILTGDHVLPTVHPGIGLGGRGDSNPLRDYLHSLDVVSSYDDHHVLPGHGYRFTGLAARIDQTRRHHLRRSAEVAEVLESVARDDSDLGVDELTVWRVAERVRWSAGWSGLSGPYLQAALNQIAMHIDYLRIIPQE